MDRGRIQAIDFKLARQAPRSDLGVRKHDHLSEGMVANQLGHCRTLVLGRRHTVDGLGNVLGERIAARHFDEQWRVEEGLGQLADLI